MPHVPMTPENFELYVAKLAKTHGPNARTVAKQMEWQRMLADLFNDARPAGRRFQLFTDLAERVKGEVTGNACFEVWEDLNYKKNQPNEFWKGVHVSMPPEATLDDAIKLMADAFKSPEKWPLKG